MKRFQITVSVFLFLFAGLIEAQEIAAEKITLTLPKAVQRVIENYPTVKIQEYAIEQAEGQKTTAGLLPNPVVTFYREDLTRGGQEAGETTIFAGLPLNFIWSRWSKMSPASSQVEAERLALADVQRLLTFEVQTAFAEAHIAQQNYQAWQKAAAVFKQAAEASRARFTEGDMAGYDQQRIMVESLRYQKAETEAKIRINNSQRRLAFLIDPGQSETRFETSAVFPSPVPDITVENLVTQSLENRPDLLAARAMLRSRQAGLTANKWRQLPDITAAAGYKKQVDDFKGAVVQVSIGVPLFDRNQGNVRRARAAVNQQTLAVELLEKRVALEVRQAHETCQLYRKQVEQFLEEGPQRAEQLLETALYSYREGEMSLLELLDGVRAYTESFQARNDLLLKYQLSLYKLEKALGTQPGNSF